MKSMENLPTRNMIDFFSQKGCNSNKIFYILLILFEAAVISLYFFVDFPKEYYGTDDVNMLTSYENLFYSYFKIMTDQSIFILVGFGFLYQFFKLHRFTSLCITLFCAMISMQLYILIGGLMEKCWTVSFNNKIKITYLNIIASMKATVSMMVCLGFLICRLNILNIFLVTIFEICLFSINEALLFRQIGFLDMVGASYIHLFGSVFGMLTMFIYLKYHNISTSNLNLTKYFSLTISFIGLVTLWVYFPSFNAINPNYSINSNINFNQRFLSIYNTYLSLISSTLSTFVVSMIIHDGKLHIFDIFIGSVSGGVMIAGTCDMFTIPFPSLIIGTCSGIISTLTYEYLNIKLEKIGINDVKGIVNSHLIPGFLGNITSIIVVLMLGKEWFCSKLKIQNEYIPFGR